MTPAMLRRIAAVLGAALVLWGIVFVWRRGERDEPGTLRLPPVDTSRVERIALRRTTDTIVATRVSGAWSVNGFRPPLNTSPGFLAAYADSSIRTELVAQAPASHGRLGVDSAAGRRFSMEAGGAVVADFVLGNRGPDFEGTYLRSRSDSTVYLLHRPDRRPPPRCAGCVARTAHRGSLPRQHQAGGGRGGRCRLAADAAGRRWRAGWRTGGQRQGPALPGAI